MARPQRILLAILCTLLLGTGVSTLTYRVYETFQTPRSYDLFVFSQGTIGFWNSGRMYHRHDDMATLYGPGTAVFKFPPAYQLPLVAWLRHGRPDNFYSVHRAIWLGIYLLACTLLLYTLLTQYFPALDNTQKVLLLSLGVFHSGTSFGFASGFQLQNAEIPLLLLLVCSLHFLRSRPASSGTMIAIAAHYKLYPGFMVLSAFASQSCRTWLIAFVIASAAILGTTLLVFGAQENLFFLTEVLPILLKEQLVIHIENVSLGTFFTENNQLTATAQLVSEWVKILVLAASVVLVKTIPAPTARTASLMFASFVTGMLLCLSNYWVQYWVLLLIPVLLLTALCIERKSWVLLVLLTLAASTLNIKPEWPSIVSLLNIDLSMIDLNAASQQVAELGTRKALFLYSKTAWLFYWLYELRLLVPLGLWISLNILLWKTWKQAQAKPCS